LNELVQRIGPWPLAPWPDQAGWWFIVARVRIMYWKEIPAQVQAEDGAGAVSRPLAARFQEGVDAISMLDGSGGTDDYLDAWEWAEYTDIEGSAEEAADAAAERLNQRFPEDFVSRIRDLHRSGKRDPRPGAVDGWLDEK
jgi:hypothetical protein